VPRIINEIGNRYGRLLVLKQAGVNRFGLVLWLCQCDCGNKTITSGRNLRIGDTRSCGCLLREKRKKGLRHLPEGEAIFNAMLYTMKKMLKKES